MTDVSDLRLVVKRHIESCPKWMLECIEPDYFLDTEQLHIANADDAIDRLDRLGEGIQDAWRAYSEMHDDYRIQLENAARSNAKTADVDLTLKPFWRTPNEEPAVMMEPVGVLLEHLFFYIYGHDPKDVQARRPVKSAVRQAADAVMIDQPKAKEIASETLQRAMLVARARQLWAMYKGKPPKKPSDGAPFFVFVEDIIAAVGKDWKTESTFRAWARKKEHMDRNWVPSLLS